MEAGELVLGVEDGEGEVSGVGGQHPQAGDQERQPPSEPVRHGAAEDAEEDGADVLYPQDDGDHVCRLY